MESGEELMSGSDERIYVSVRLRPLNGREILRNDVSDWECINEKTIVFKNLGVSASERSMYPSAYTFDRVFRSDCSTREVYERAAKDVAISVVSGINSSVFAYGQTSSGKTYTMTGITEFAIADIYEHIHKHRERAFVLKFSAMEIYNESVRDLLSVDSTPLRLLDDPERGTIVEKLTEEVLTDWNHVIQLLSICEAQRQIGETALNEMSSRSHQIIRLTIESSSRDFLGRDNASTLTASVNFVDLAGSERASQSLSAGTRLKEGCHINRSLLTLGTVIRKLSKCRGGHIPYRDSKLTRILQTSLGGNARTAIICTMSPARSHVEQSRNTLLFASCAKEVTTNAKVNVVMSDKALVKYLQRELARLESELRSPQSSVAPSDYSAILREKDVQIEKLLEEINDAILQRDIAQAQVKDLLQMLGDDDAGSTKSVGLGHYPHLRVQRPPDSGIKKGEPSILADPHCLNVDTRSCSDEISRASTEDHIVKVPYFDEDFVRSTASPRVLTSNYSESDSYNGWEEIEKQSNATSEDLCREVRCIETQESSTKVATETNSLCSEENTEVEVYVNGGAQTMESPSTPFQNDRAFKSSPSKNDSEMKEENESLPSVCNKRDNSTQFLDILSLGNTSFRHELDKDSSVSRNSKLVKSRSCNSGSRWFKMMDFGEISSSFELEKGCEKKLSPLRFSPKAESLSRNEPQSSPEDAFDIEIDTPDVKHKIKLLSEEHTYVENQTKEVESKANDVPKRSVKDVGLDPIEDECKGLSGWPAEFKRLQREIVELWHDCNVSLVHRAYFFMLFQGDPSDAIYLEVEIRRMKFLKDKFSKGEKTIVNGQSLTLASSEKALRDERRMLIHRMAKKLLEHERESLFLKWGIGLNTRFRRLQLAHTLWTKTDDMDHVADSAVLIVKLVGSTKHGNTHNKEMFGLNFTPRCSTRIGSIKRGLISFL